MIFLLGKKRHKALVPEVDTGIKDPTLDLAAHEADLYLIERIQEIRKSLHSTEFLESAASVGDVRCVLPHIVVNFKNFMCLKTYDLLFLFL